MQTFLDVEDSLFRVLSLDVWERCFYYYLLRHTHAAGRSSGMFALATIAEATGTSDTKVREAVRSMHAKGCIRIEERNKKGHLITVFLPAQIESLRSSESVVIIPDIEQIDFFVQRQYLGAILHRENNACFYCLRDVDQHSVALDHVIPLAEGGDNRHRNIVAACHECNSLKQATPAESFLRSLYRRGVLSQVELNVGITRLETLRAGSLPIVLGAPLRSASKS